ncbi:unnamed protein product [Nippostrongylus brasiliensis]|uniref:DUF4201 domain-containing protein n=1 Tax=Nippostrongylus brasiliensis TaxID=27835 RepID=A0A0N4Y965_NIPBR|nr:unnamed protein product [Nippostrongylus brasiliensis]
MLRVERETRLRHDKESLSAENEELKMRNQRLVEQLREKSAQFSKLQFHAQKLDEQIETLSQRCALSAALDNLTLDERLLRGPLTAMETVEDCLRRFQHQVQSVKLDAANIQQKTLNNIALERSAHQACLERMEVLQRENFALMQSRYLESGCDDSVYKRKIDALPSFEALYGFTQHAVRKFSDMRSTAIDREREMKRAEIDLIAAQSSLLVTHAQNERLRIRLGKKRRKRPASFHGEDLMNRVIKREMNFFLPFKLQGSRIENSRRIINKKSPDVEKDLECEFYSMFGVNRSAPPGSLEKPQKPVSRIEYMMREMSQSNKSRKAPLTPVRENVKSSASRPMSMVEVEEQRRLRRFEETRRSIKVRRQPSMESYSQRPIDTGQIPTSSLQDLPCHSPVSTPVASRKVADKSSMRLYDQLVEVSRKPERARHLERGYSMDTHDRLPYSEELRRVKDERLRNEFRAQHTIEAERRPSRIQRQPPVHLTRIKPPSQVAQRKSIVELRTDMRPSERPAVAEILDPPRPTCGSPTCSRLPKPDKKSWLDKIRSMKRS